MEKLENIYVPQPAVIDKIVDETYDTKTFTLHFRDKKFNDAFNFKSGQFVEVSILGKGEAPIGFASSPFRKKNFDITVRRVGAVTNALHEIKPKDVIGIRGPLGNSFPFHEVENYDLLFIAGGIGLPPLKSLIDPVLEHRKKFGQVTILYGARTPEDRVYKSTLVEWSKRDDLNLLQTVDRATNGWSANVGVVTTLFPKIKVDVEKTIAFTCGPPIMIRFVILDLLALGLPDERIISTLERYMKCGIGKCGHCAIGHKYVCVDGPVFSYKQIKNLPEH